jgi:hypothetical protein
LAVALGRVNVDKMLRKLTAKQFAGWEHFFQLEPFGFTRDDWHAASIATTIANVNRGKNAAYKMEDFLLKFSEEPSRKQTPEVQLAIARAIAASYSVGDKELSS